LAETPQDFDSYVRKRFSVKDSFQLPDGEVEYRVDYTPESKASFKALCSELQPLGFTPWLSGSEEDCALVVRKKQTPHPSLSRIPVLMALFTVASVVAYGILEFLIYADFAPTIPGYVVFLSYTACILAILVAHEFGHRYAAERRGTVAPVPYLIPGIPGITAFLPSLGTVSTQREPALNKDLLFDISIAGPLAAFGITVVLYALSAFVAVPSSAPLSGTQAINGYFSVSQLNPSVLQTAMDSALSPFLQQLAPGYLRLSPVSDAASIGFVLTFLSLLPMSFFDGGYLASTILRERGLRVATYLSIAVLIAIDTPSYWAPALFTLIIASRQQRSLLLDEVSKPSRSKRAILVLAIVLAFLCLPIPQNLITFPLP
jgi:peptidase M50-like protein